MFNLKSSSRSKSLLNKHYNLPKLREIVYILRSLNTIEKFLFFFLGLVFVTSSLLVVWKVNENFLINIPASGGILKEGILGTPRFINPLLEISDADKDLVNLIYSGLMRPDNKGGLIPDLAEKYEISEDGLVYTFTLKPDLVWHDKEPITVDDVIFTIEQAKDPGLKSSKRANWEGVMIEKINDREISFILEKAYAPFLENNTMGILPKHIWENATSDRMIFSDFNVNPIGSGPYKIKKINRNSSGVIISYLLIANDDFALKKTNIEELVLKFYQSEEKLIKAYQDGDIDSVSAISPKLVKEISTGKNIVNTFYLPRVFGVFLNQNNANVLAEIEIRKALNISADKERIINEVMFGFGSEMENPLPPGTFGSFPEELKAQESVIIDPTENEEMEKDATSTDPILQARDILERNGWVPNEEDGVFEKNPPAGGKKETLRFEFSLSTSNVPELKQTAEILKETWEKIGARVNLKIFEIGDLNQNIIRPRKYDALLFGEIVGKDPDPFVFWHSSQRNDPGLNIAMYANITVDKLLEDARFSLDKKVREEKYIKFQNEVSRDIPAVFLYSPKFIYITPKLLNGVNETISITVPSERFSQIYEWYSKTDKVWTFFAK